MWLIFDTYEKANNSLSQINQNFGFPDENGTKTWAVIEKAHDQNYWFFPKPPESKMTDVVVFQTTNNIDNFLPSNSLLI